MSRLRPGVPWFRLAPFGGGSADVSGPASSTDNALVRFDGATGKLIQNSGVILDDTNNISGLGTVGSGAITSTGASQFGSITLTTDLAVTEGGTGASTLTGLLQGNGTSAFTVITNSSTVGQVLRVTGAATYAWGALDLADGDAITGALGAANGGTGITSLGTGVATFLGTPSAANLASAVTGTTGTGNLVFATSPTFTTPLLGTPTSGTLTNCTGLPLSTGVTGQLPLANGGTAANLSDPNADRILFWDDSAGAVTWLEAGSGLTITTTTITASGSGAAANRMVCATTFEDSARFTATVLGSGTVAFNTNGALLTTTAADTDSASLEWGLAQSGLQLYVGSPVFSLNCRMITLNAASGTADMYFGIGACTVAASGITFTDKHIGFKITKASGTVSLYATQADGTTETASSALTTLANSDNLDLIAVVNGTTSVDYYWRKEGGSLSSATNLTTNIPTSTTVSVTRYSISNDSTAFALQVYVSNSAYIR